MKANKNNKGFTLVESLVALLTATIVTGMLLIVVDLAKNTYIELEKNAEGQVLSAVLINNIQDELRFASNVESASGTVDNASEYYFTYYSTSSQTADCQIVGYSHKDDNGTDKQDEKIYVKFGNSYRPLTGNSSYVYDLQAHVDAKYNETAKNFIVYLKIYDSNNVTLIENTFIVEPLNKNSL